MAQQRLKPKGTYLTPDQIKMIRKRMVDKELSGRKLAGLIPMGNASLCNKLNGREEMTQTQIYRLSVVLDIPLEEIPNYFFNIELSDAKEAI